MKDLSRRELFETGALLTAGALPLLRSRPVFAQEGAPKPEGIYQTLRDPKIVSELEMKHVPLIQAPDTVKKGELFEIKVRIGRVQHPMEMPHHIEWIHFFKDNRPLAAVQLSREGVAPSATLSLSLLKSAEIQVKILCNLHGYWMETKKIDAG